MAITPRVRSSAASADSRLMAPRSLKEAVNCWFSNLSQVLQPRISDSVRLQLQSVSTIAPCTRARAASTSSSVTGSVADAVAGLGFVTAWPHAILRQSRRGCLRCPGELMACLAGGPEVSRQLAGVREWRVNIAFSVASTADG